MSLRPCPAQVVSRRAELALPIQLGRWFRTGGRKVDSGLLVVKPLAKAQVPDIDSGRLAEDTRAPLGAVGPMKESWRRGEDCLGNDTLSESEERTGSGWFYFVFFFLLFKFSWPTLLEIPLGVDR